MLEQCGILLLLALLGPSSATNLTCNNDSGYCVIQPKKVKADEAVNFVNIPAETHEIIIKSCELTRIPHQLFLEVKDLRVLDLRYNKIQDVGGSELENAHKLIKLSLKNNSLTILKNNGFISTTLTDLDLSSNMIKEIEVNAFSRIVNLISLDLNYNQLKMLNDEVFKNLASIEFLSIEGNFLKKISNNLLTSNQGIDFLHLGSNLIDTIEEGALSTLNELFSLQIKNNLMTTSPELPKCKSCNVEMTSNLLQTGVITDSMKGLWVENNMITTINCSANMTIIFLFATNNSLTNFGCIGDMNNLITLNLAYNKITDVTKDMFMKLKKLETLNLSFNLIKEVKPSMFSGLLSLYLLHVDVMLDSENILAELPRLTQIYLTTSSWGCEKLLAAAKIFKDQNIMMGMNNPQYGTKIICQMEKF